MTTSEVANTLVALCKEGKFMEAINSLYAETIVSKESMGPMPVVEGIEAVRGKADHFMKTMEVHSVTVDGPWTCQDQFIVKFDLDATDKTSGETRKMSEFAVYTVKNGKVTQEAFFYGA